MSKKENISGNFAEIISARREYRISVSASQAGKDDICTAHHYGHDPADPPPGHAAAALKLFEHFTSHEKKKRGTVQERRS